jgi:hypothetical protein
MILSTFSKQQQELLREVFQLDRRRWHGGHRAFTISAALDEGGQIGLRNPNRPATNADPVAAQLAGLNELINARPANSEQMRNVSDF